MLENPHKKESRMDVKILQNSVTLLKIPIDFAIWGTPIQTLRTHYRVIICIPLIHLFF